MKSGLYPEERFGGFNLNEGRDPLQKPEDVTAKERKSGFRFPSKSLARTGGALPCSTGYEFKCGEKCIGEGVEMASGMSRSTGGFHVW